MFIETDDFTKELVSAFNDGYAQGVANTMRQLRDCRNELCLKCGDYKNAHKGACDDCRWRDVHG